MSPLAVVAPCWGRIARDHRGRPTAVLIDYWGDAPPEGLLAALREMGWDAPRPAPPPAPAIEWRPVADPATGRRWTLRPYAVTDALAVARRGTETEQGELDELLVRYGVVLDGTPIANLSLPSEAASGRTTVDRDAQLGSDPLGRPSARAWALGGDEPEGDGSPPAPPAPVAPPLPVRRRDGTPPVPAVRAGASALTVVAPSATPEPWGDAAARPEPRRLFGPLDGDPASARPVGRTPATRPVCVVHAVVRNGSVPAIGVALARLDLLDEAAVGSATGAGREGGQVVTYRGTRTAQLYPRSWVEVPVPAERVDEVVEGLVAAVRRGRESDGKVWVT